MDIWLTADTHFDHFQIIEYESRPFNTPIEMTDSLIENWNSVVKPNDLIFHIGDVFFCNAKRMEIISSKLNGRKILVEGNHDSRFTKKKFCENGFQRFRYYFIDEFLLSHYPQPKIPLAVAKSHDLLLGNVHGHTHSNISHLDQSLYKCVSTELTDYTPIHLDEIKQHFSK